MQLHEVDRLLNPAPLPLETGYERLPDGSLHVCCRTDMRNCTGAMFEWWLQFRPNTQHYTWWHPVDHLFSDWGGVLSDSTHVGSEHIVTEEFTGMPPTDVRIQFRDESEFFDESAYSSARLSGAISASVVGRVGMGHEPARDDEGRVIGGRLIHLGRDTPWGMALRSHFYMGSDLPALGLTPEQVAEEVPDAFGIALLQHCYNEFTFLSRFLPSLYAGEHPDRKKTPLPW